MKKGFTLIETLIAIMVLLLMLTGPLSLAINSIGTAFVSQNKIAAFYLAQEAMEYILNIRDSNALNGQDWLQGLNTCIQGATSGCVVDVHAGSVQSCAVPCNKVVAYDPSVGFYVGFANDSQAPTKPFTRVIKVIKRGSDEAKVTVTITWPEKFGGERSLVLQKEIFNWK